MSQGRRAVLLGGLPIFLIFASTALDAKTTAHSPRLGDKLYDECINRTSTNSDWADCGGEYLERLEKNLNFAWKRALASLATDDRTYLIIEQRAWLRYRDLSCKYWSAPDAGRESQVLDFPLCRAAITSERITNLNAINDQMHEGEPHGRS